MLLLKDALLFWNSAPNYNQLNAETKLWGQVDLVH